MIRLYTTAFAVSLLSAPVLAEQDYGRGSDLPEAQHGQHWRDAGTPWKDAGQQFKSIWRGISNDAKDIGPAVRQDFSEPPRWNWSPDSGTRTVAPSSGAYYSDSVPATSTGLIYLPAEPATQYVPQDTYTAQPSYTLDTYAPVEVIPYAETAPATTPIPAYPTYEMAPIQN